MTSMVGADLEQVRALAASFDRAAAQLNQTSTTVRNGHPDLRLGGTVRSQVPAHVGLGALGQAATGRQRTVRAGEAATAGGRPAGVRRVLLSTAPPLQGGRAQRS